MSELITVAVTTRPICASVSVGVSTPIKGPPGADGTDGTNGTNAVSLMAVEQTAPTNGAQTISLPYPVAFGWSLLCVNGLRQPVTGYSVSGSVLSLPAALGVLAGDLISFDYYPTL